MMKKLILPAAVLSVATLIQCAERAPAATQLVTANDVQLVSEQTLVEEGPAFGRAGNSGKNGKGGGKTLDYTFYTIGGYYVVE